MSINLKANKSIKDFIDEEVHSVLGFNSQAVYLVNMGRQLNS